VRRLDPDDRSIEGDRLIREHRWRLWQKPTGDEQQSRKRASDEDKIPGYRQRSSLLKIEQFRFTCSLERRRSDGHWSHVGHERHEAQHPDGEYGQTQYAPHIGSRAVSILR
jgi:hypothetical protein